MPACRSRIDFICRSNGPRTRDVARKHVFPGRSRSKPNQRSRWRRSVKPLLRAYRKGRCSRTRATATGVSALGLKYVAAIIPTVMVRSVTDDGELGPRLSVKTLALGLPKKAWRRSPGARELTRSCAPASPAFKCARHRSGAPQHEA